MCILKRDCCVKRIISLHKIVRLCKAVEMNGNLYYFLLLNKPCSSPVLLNLEKSRNSKDKLLKVKVIIDKDKVSLGPALQGESPLQFKDAFKETLDTMKDLHLILPIGYRKAPRIS